MQKEFTLQNIEVVAAELCSNLNHYKVWAFDAEMGAGKTTLIHAICNVLKVADTVGSPTFSIINQYQTQAGNTIYHLDLYRIKDEEEAIQAGVEDVLYSGSLCLIEWPGKINSLLPSNTVFIKLDILNSNTRRISIQYPN